MKYPCNLIQDLLPLYHDGVCSGESTNIVETHLSECMACKEYYHALCAADKILVTRPMADRELQKAASLRGIRKKLLRKQAIIIIMILTVLAAAVSLTAAAVKGLLENSVNVIGCRDNISVSMTDEGLMGRLQGNQADFFTVRRVETMEDGQMNTYLFFYMSGSKWDEITTSDRVFSEYVLCPADKGAVQVDAVYYYTGDYTGIENMSKEDLQQVLDSSILLWNKQEYNQ